MASKFRFFNPSGPKEDPVEKRRAQLRRAQQTYRERKTRYVKALEKDLASSRQRECDAARDNDQLNNTIHGLLLLLTQHNITVPDQLPVDASPVPAPVPSQTTGKGNIPSPSGFLVSPVSESDPNRQSEWPRYAPSPTQGLALGNPPRVCDLDQVTLGMQFVLKIEEPCLGHVHGDPKTPNEASGHALTVTSQVLCLSTSQPPKTAALVPFQNTPTAILDRLLTLAPEVACDGEMTPVQAWNDLRRRPMFRGLGFQNLLQLAEKLRDAVTCHGFGAVVDYNIFQSMVRDLLVQRTSF